MAWTTDEQIENALCSVLQLGDAADLPAHWDELVTAGNEDGYHHIVQVLSGRGFTVAQMDTWAARYAWNRIAGLYFTIEAANLDDDRALAALDRLWKRLENLGVMTLVDEGGEIIEPEGGAGGQVGYGTFLPSDDDLHAIEDVL